MTVPDGLHLRGVPGHILGVGVVSVLHLPPAVGRLPVGEHRVEILHGLLIALLCGILWLRLHMVPVPVTPAAPLPPRKVDLLTAEAGADPVSGPHTAPLVWRLLVILPPAAGQLILLLQVHVITALVIVTLVTMVVFMIASLVMIIILVASLSMIVTVIIVVTMVTVLIVPIVLGVVLVTTAVVEHSPEVSPATTASSVVVLPPAPPSVADCGMEPVSPRIIVKASSSPVLGSATPGIRTSKASEPSTSAPVSIGSLVVPSVVMSTSSSVTEATSTILLLLLFPGLALLGLWGWGRRRGGQI